jgi:hypothetical protein
LELFMEAQPTGLTRICSINEHGYWTPRSGLIPNKRTALGGFLEARCLGFGDPAYRISAAYLEYQNLSDPSTVIATPTPAFNDTIAYYAGLGTAGADFLRVPLQVSPTIGIIPGNEAFFSAGQGNELAFLIQSTGTTGIFGTPFSAGSNSKVYGVALVATPVPNDQTQDILFARAYYSGSAQVLVPANGQVGITYFVPLGPSS